MIQGFTGVSFPFRIGSKGGVVMSTTSDTDYSHINESIRQIILTRKGERVNLVNFGCNLQDALFENLDPGIANMIKYTITEALKTYEPRITVNDVRVIPDESTAYVTVDYTVVSTKVETSTTVRVGGS